MDQNFPPDLQNYPLTLSFGMSKFSTLTQVEKNISRGQPRPHPKEAGTQFPQIFGTLLMPNG